MPMVTLMHHYQLSYSASIHAATRQLLTRQDISNQVSNLTEASMHLYAENAALLKSVLCVNARAMCDCGPKVRRSVHTDQSPPPPPRTICPRQQTIHYVRVSAAYILYTLINSKKNFR